MITFPENQVRPAPVVDVTRLRRQAHARAARSRVEEILAMRGWAWNAAASKGFRESPS
jgi:hypothetical protein